MDAKKTTPGDRTDSDGQKAKHREYFQSYMEARRNAKAAEKWKEPYMAPEKAERQTWHCALDTDTVVNIIALYQGKEKVMLTLSVRRK
jgi:hypothetical protein